MKGFVTATTPFGYGFITYDETQPPMFFVEADAPADSIGRRYLLRNEEVEFEIGKNNKGACARNLKLLSPRAEENIDLETYREKGVLRIINTGGKSGLIKRDPGALIYLHQSDIAGGALVLGTRFEYAVRRRGVPNADPWKAVNAVPVIQAEIHKPNRRRSLDEATEENWATFA
jgi:cold shock CspA family protein